MRSLGFVSLLLTLGIIGYLLMKQTGESRQGVSAAQAQVMEDKARDAMALADGAQLKTAISAFQQAKQRWPASLDELKTAGLIEYVPANVDYDPSTGEVKPKGAGPDGR